MQFGEQPLDRPARAAGEARGLIRGDRVHRPVQAHPLLHRMATRPAQLQPAVQHPPQPNAD